VSGSAEVRWERGSRFGRYELGDRVARGGMADVWRAWAIGVGGFRREVAIKTMRPEIAWSADLVQMFIDEAVIASRLHHPAIVQVFDFGRLRSGHYFMAMEYVPGVTLRQLARALRLRGRRLPRTFLLRVVAEIAGALAYLHQLPHEDGRAGIVHGDVSPENVLVSAAGAAKLIDFGAASVETAATALAPICVGKIPYVAPERLRGHAGDGRSDTYALGVILYEHLAGRRPFHGSKIVPQILEARPWDLRARLPDLPAEIAATVRRAMAPDPDARFTSIAELADELALAPARSLGGPDPREATPTEIDQILGMRARAGGASSAIRRHSRPPVSATREAPDSFVTAPLPVVPPAFPADHAAAGPQRLPGADAPATPPLPPPEDRDPVAAALCFARGRALVRQQRLLDALACWARAAVLEPDRRSYFRNLRRLMRRIAARGDRDIAPPTWRRARSSPTTTV
jgi:serine/threonine-protein kinase